MSSSPTHHSAALRLSKARKAVVPLPTKQPPPPVKPLFDLDGKNPTADAFKTILNEKHAGFMNPTPAHQGTLGVVTQGITATLSALDTPRHMLDMAIAMGTADVAAIWPEFPAAVLHSSVHIGFHAHAHPPSLIPPGPPVVLCSTGIPRLSGAVSVLVNGLPAARADDIGLAVTCGSLAPPFEIMLGSSKVFIGGSRAARMFDVTRHDNPLPTGGLLKISALKKLVDKANDVVAKVKTMDAVADAMKPIKVIYDLRAMGVLAMDVNHANKKHDEHADRAATLRATAKDMAQLEAERLEANPDAPAQATEAASLAAQAELGADASAAEAVHHFATASGKALTMTTGLLQYGLDQTKAALEELIGKDPGIGLGYGNLLGTSPNVFVGGIPSPNLTLELKGLVKAALTPPTKPGRSTGPERQVGVG